MRPVPAGGDVCCVLKRSSDRWVRSSVRRPHNKTVLNTMLPQFPDFVPVVRKFTVECRLCDSAGCRCNGGGHAHVQGRTASQDSSFCQNISRPGLLQASCRRPQRERKRCALAWLRQCCRFLQVPTVGPGRDRCTDTVRHPPRLCCRVSSEHWQCSRAASGHFPRTRPGGTATCGRPACGTGPLAAGPLWRGVLQTPETSPVSGPRKLRLELRRTESALPGR